jgi:hypothetical protein
VEPGSPGFTFLPNLPRNIQGDQPLQKLSAQGGRPRC